MCVCNSPHTACRQVVQAGAVTCNDAVMVREKLAPKPKGMTYIAYVYVGVENNFH